MKFKSLPGQEPRRGAAADPRGARPRRRHPQAARGAVRRHGRPVREARHRGARRRPRARHDGPRGRPRRRRAAAPRSRPGGSGGRAGARRRVLAGACCGAPSPTRSPRASGARRPPTRPTSPRPLLRPPRPRRAAAWPARAPPPRTRRPRRLPTCARSSRSGSRASPPATAASPCARRARPAPPLRQQRRSPRRRRAPCRASPPCRRRTTPRPRTSCSSLERAGVDADRAAGLVEAARLHLRPFDERPFRDLVRDLIATRVRVEHGWTPDGAPRRIAVIGPSGAGKTTAVASLAAAWTRAGLAVGVIAVDAPGDVDAGLAQRLGGEAERALAYVAGSACLRVASAADAARALLRLGACDVVLLDLPGIGGRDDDAEHLLGDAILACQPHEVHAAVPLGIAPREADAVLARAARLGANRLLVTKTDEARFAGPLFDLADRSALPISYLGASRRVRVAGSRERGLHRAPHPADLVADRQRRRAHGEGRGGGGSARGGRRRAHRRDRRADQGDRRDGGLRDRRLHRPPRGRGLGRHGAARPRRLAPALADRLVHGPRAGARGDPSEGRRRARRLRREGRDGAAPDRRDAARARRDIPDSYLEAGPRRPELGSGG